MGSFLLLFLLAAVTMPATSQTSEKLLIEFGWDEPTPAFMRKHIAQMEQTPFDGCVYHVQYQDPDGKRANLMNACWGTRAFTDAELQNAVDDLRATPFTKFKHNFLRFNVLPGTVDWFDDFGPIENNARQSARIARLAHSAGVLFDIEQYDFQLFNHAKQRDAKTKSWDDYAKQARTRGEQVMRAFQTGWHTPEAARLPAVGGPRPLTLFLTFGMSLPHRESTGDRAKLRDTEYGLLAPFLDGLYAAAHDTDVIVDGFEFAYGYREPKQFDDAKQTVKETVAAFVPDRDRYLKHTSLAFGLWLDFDWRKHGYDPADPSRNYFTPAAFASSLREAFARSDRYVWIYTETPRWWTEAGTMEKLPPPYVDAIKAARPARP